MGEVRGKPETSGIYSVRVKLEVNVGVNLGINAGVNSGMEVFLVNLVLNKLKNLGIEEAELSYFLPMSSDSGIVSCRRYKGACSCSYQGKLGACASAARTRTRRHVHTEDTRTALDLLRRTHWFQRQPQSC